MTESFAGMRQTVTCILRVPDGTRDDYGNAVLVDSELEIADCLIAPTGGQEDTSDADRVVDSATIYNLTGTWPDDSPINRVRLNDGTIWEVDGAPQRWPYAIGGVVVQLRKVRG